MTTTTAARPAAVWQLGPRTENASMAVVPKSNAVNARAGNRLNASKNAAAVMTMMTTKGTTPVKNAVAPPHVQRTKPVSMVVGPRKNADNAFGDNKLNALKNAAAVMTMMIKAAATTTTTIVPTPVPWLLVMHTKPVLAAVARKKNADSVRAALESNACATAAATTTTNAPLAANNRREPKPNVVSMLAVIQTAVAKKRETTKIAVFASAAEAKSTLYQWIMTIV